MTSITAQVFAQSGENNQVGKASFDQVLLARMVLEETNVYRLKHGRSALEFSPLLGMAAQGHATAMQRGGFFAHKNVLDTRQRTLSDRVNLAGMHPQAVGENIAMTFSRDFNNSSKHVHTYRSLSQSIVKQWADSRGHRANMLSRSYALIGLGFTSEGQSGGYEKILCVQTFSSPVKTLAVNSSIKHKWN